MPGVVPPLLFRLRRHRVELLGLRRGHADVEPRELVQHRNPHIADEMLRVVRRHRGKGLLEQVRRQCRPHPGDLRMRAVAPVVRQPGHRHLEHETLEPPVDPGHDRHHHRAAAVPDTGDPVRAPQQEIRAPAQRQHGLADRGDLVVEIPKLQAQPEPARLGQVERLRQESLGAAGGVHVDHARGRRAFRLDQVTGHPVAFGVVELAAGDRRAGTPGQSFGAVVERGGGVVTQVGHACQCPRIGRTVTGSGRRSWVGAEHDCCA
nr:hypothetical protein [Kibdelosporangium sp. MJ126-NF4]CTQ88238.1 hypothetical protein [Kibdelosporangium sp. MJ126-NF4]